MKLQFVRVVFPARITDRMYSSVKNQVGQESEERWRIGCCREARRSFGQNPYPSMYHGLIVSTRHFLPEHTHPRRQWKIEWTFWNSHAPVLPIMHHAHRTKTANAHPLSNSSHMFKTARIMIIKQKNRNMKMKRRREDLKVWYTYCLAHHLLGASNTEYPAHPLVSKNVITCYNTLMTLEMKNRKLLTWFDTRLYSLFSLPPPKGWSPQTYIFRRFVSKTF